MYDKRNQATKNRKVIVTVSEWVIFLQSFWPVRSKINIQHRLREYTGSTSIYLISITFTISFQAQLVLMIQMSEQARPSSCHVGRSSYPLWSVLSLCHRWPFQKEPAFNPERTEKGERWAQKQQVSLSQCNQTIVCIELLNMGVLFSQDYLIHQIIPKPQENWPPLASCPRWVRGSGSHYDNMKMECHLLWQHFHQDQRRPNVQKDKKRFGNYHRGQYLIREHK